MLVYRSVSFHFGCEFGDALQVCDSGGTSVGPTWQGCWNGDVACPPVTDAGDDRCANVACFRDGLSFPCPNLNYPPSFSSCSFLLTMEKFHLETICSVSYPF